MSPNRRNMLQIACAAVAGTALVPSVVRGATAITDQNKAIISRFFEDGVNKGDINILNEVLDQEQASKYLADLKAKFFEYEERIEDMVAENDRVVVRTSGSCTRRVNGERVKWTAMTMYQMTNGKVTRRWTEFTPHKN